VRKALVLVFGTVVGAEFKGDDARNGFLQPFKGVRYLLDLLVGGVGLVLENDDMPHWRLFVPHETCEYGKAGQQQYKEQRD
jgi:hypothetical protein